jgi:hypothetical protein
VKTLICMLAVMVSCKADAKADKDVIDLVTSSVSTPTLSDWTSKAPPKPEEPCYYKTPALAEKVNGIWRCDTHPLPVLTDDELMDIIDGMWKHDRRDRAEEKLAGKPKPAHCILPDVCYTDLGGCWEANGDPQDCTWTSGEYRPDYLHFTSTSGSRFRLSYEYPLPPTEEELAEVMKSPSWRMGIAKIWGRREWHRCVPSRNGIYSGVPEDDCSPTPRYRLGRIEKETERYDKPNRNPETDPKIWDVMQKIHRRAKAWLDEHPENIKAP